MAAATAHAENLSGHWCGVGEQTSADGTKSYWSANLTLDGAGGRMDYPSLDCGGTLTFERADGNVRSYRERIEYGRDKCLDDGLVRVERQGTSVRWEWTGSGIEARALLTPNCLESAPKTGSAEPATPAAYASLETSSRRTGSVSGRPRIVSWRAFG